MGEVLAINVSAVRGIEKNSINEVMVVEGWGLEGDAHGGDWSKQVSIFPVEAMEKVPLHKKQEVLSGGYTENFTIAGINPDQIKVGTKVKLGEAIIEIFHVGKEIFKESGRPYIVSREGRFGKVIKGGLVKVGDKIIVEA
ncbi:MOSC domain protein [Desulforamulus reducens MI-1]|uniref:MOSC domain protein n=1 Tax=Desulforamulus reducens (strain ATCC BAA-1160 / DSM 100696 / MI-1) TaxID=349161 RepID=A4J290_DESRM|nr:sulfurase [Desulforamulus reducens]ABO49193.1 MOSC domain protein [Desulforamulus reducens MI-1]